MANIERRNRATARRQVKKSIMALIYKHTYMKRDDFIHEIGKENATLRGYHGTAFIQNGNTYPFTGLKSALAVGQSVPYLDKALVPKFLEVMAEIKEDLRTDYSVIEAYINNMLNRATNVDELAYLLPECLHQAFYEGTLHSVRFTESTKTTLDLIKSKNAANIGIVKRRLTVNLLLG